MEEAMSFLRALQGNNNREWFQAHKGDYLAAQASFNRFAEEMLSRLVAFDTSLEGVTLRDCTYRIYRDTRFSTDKRPYKCHFGLFACPGGKRSGYAGYYFQIGADESGWPDGCMLAAGHYCIEPRAIQVIREDIFNGEGDFNDIVTQAAPFAIDASEVLKRNPKGFPTDAPWGDYLRLKNYCLNLDVNRQFFAQDNLADRLTALFQRAKPFLDYINRAIAYSRGE